MPGCVNNINLYPVMHDRCILGKNRDTPFPLQRIGIHNSFRHFLVFPENMALFEHSIDKGRFTVVDMSDDRNITNIFSNHFFLSSPYIKLKIYLLIITQKYTVIFRYRKYSLL